MMRPSSSSSSFHAEGNGNGSGRAALFKMEERRRHFTASIKKYEAKLHRDAREKAPLNRINDRIEEVVQGGILGSRRHAKGECPNAELQKVVPPSPDLEPSEGVHLIPLHPSVKQADSNALAAAFGIRIRGLDMAVPLQEHAFRCARYTLGNSEEPNFKLLAYTLKKEFDEAYGPAWHCIVGTSFGSYVTHSMGGFVYFSMDKVSALLFKTTVEPVQH